MEKFVCIHGHFYQPPRENPWLEAVESQESARPHHDWNERVTAECYAPNAVARILDDKGLISRIVNNYEKISFDVGPTLVSWLQRKAPDVHEAIIEADRRGAESCGGHGPAMAQAYSHMIMPLASSRDKRTQIIWGIEDFRHRFKRMPEGMWLPETAVDLETLDIMAGCGIKFTVLAPHQAERTRPLGGKWKEVPNQTVDPKMPYLCNLPSGRTIAVFFYDGPVSRAVAFEGLLESGANFAERLDAGFKENGNSSGIFHIATDGESYGHHHRFGDMALAFAVHHIESKGIAKITNYAEYLSLYPPSHEAEIIEGTSWSCVHGIERWRADCGCNTGGPEGWNQKWRGPLRDALDNLREGLSDVYERLAPELMKDPWRARDEYIEVILNRRSADSFLERHSTGPLNAEEKVRALKLLEIERNSMLMFTSCGWFFSDISGIEAVQILLYAGRAIQLCKELSGGSPEPEFLGILSKAESNKPSEGSGADIYEKSVRSATAGPERVCANYAMSRLFDGHKADAVGYSFSVRPVEHSISGVGKTRLATGICDIRSDITGQEDRLSFAGLRLMGHDITCCVRKSGDVEPHRAFASGVSPHFERGDFNGVLSLMDRHFKGARYFLGDMFRDGREEIINSLLSESASELESEAKKAFRGNRALLQMLLDMGLQVPERFFDAAKCALNAELLEEIETEFEAGKLAGIIKEMKKWGLSPDDKALGPCLRRRLEAGMKLLESAPGDIAAIDAVQKTLETIKAFPFPVNTWEAQNSYYKLAIGFYPSMSKKPDAQKWIESFAALGAALNFSPEILTKA